MIINTQFYKNSFPRVLCFILVKDIDRSVTPLDAARVNRTIFHNHSVSKICYYYIVARPNIYIICITPVFSSTSRLFNVLSYPHVNSMLALLYILDMSTCYHHSSASGMRQNVVQKSPKICSTPQSKPWHSEGYWLA